MRLIPKFHLFLILAVISTSLSFSTANPILAAPPPPVKPDLVGLAEEAQQAIENAILSQPERSLGFLVYDTRIENIKISRDSIWAAGYLVPHDPLTGETLPIEPGVAITHQTEQGWEVYFPGDEAYQEALTSLPAEVLDPGILEQLLIMDQIQETTVPSGPLSGYRLPWEAGKTTYVSQTVAHDRYTPSGNAHYSFDFYVPQTMFNLYAAKAGTVWSYRDDVPNGDPTAGNYIVLEDTTTIPTTYQLYLHLAQDSIPPDLKVIGAPVQRGQYVGIADDTGVSTGHHLHFQVQTFPYYTAYWGVSVDIVFEEVSINGGRPRVNIDLPYCTWEGDVCDEFQSAYVSANTITGDHTAPSGDFTNITTGAKLTSQELMLEGWAYDNESELYSIQVIANYDGLWREIGPSYNTSPFSTTLDLCSLGIPDGPLSLALRLRDSSGNVSLDLPGLRQIIKEYSCPSQPPACTPSSTQVALFAETAYGGACTIFNPGTYSGSTTLGAVGSNNAASIMVGSSVLATLYSAEDYTGRSETIENYDRNLSDNRTGNDQLSSLKVVSRSSLPAVPQPVWPDDGNDDYTSDRSLTLSWRDQGGGTRYKVRLSGPNGTQESEWLEEPRWRISTLSAGAYSWQVQAGNDSGVSAWSETNTLSIQTSSLPAPASVNAPYVDDMEDTNPGWQHSNYWDRAYITGNPNGGEISWIYDTGIPDSYATGAPNEGDLTSPRVYIPSSGYYLRFSYRYETESPGTQWDQRWVQISTGGPYTNLLQLNDDTPNKWLQSPAINLDAYAGKNVQVRFYFTTIDDQQNDFQGWTIDDVSITSTSPDVCADNDGLEIVYGQSYVGTLCPGGDVDYFQFQGQEGDRIGILAEADPESSPVDSVLYLLDQDGSSILAENDDIVYAVQTDSFVQYRLPAAGTYFIKLKDWAHPTAGGEEYTYKLTLTRDADLPKVSLISPESSIYLPSSPFSIQVNASDLSSGVNQVEFYLHEGNWISDKWVYLGADSEGSDGWSWLIDPGIYLEQTEMAIYARALDWAGNSAYAAAWGLALDRTAPVSELAALPALTANTAIVLDWTATDNLSGVGSFDLQVQPSGLSWQTFATGVSGTLRQAVYIGEIGQTYNFRMRAVDLVGNVEIYSISAEASTSISNSICTYPDIWEKSSGSTNDNQVGTANMISTTFAEQVHNLCNPLSTDHLDDEDWLSIDLKAGVQLIANATPMYPGAAIVLELFDSDGVTLLQQGTPQDFGYSTLLLWRSDQNRRVYLRMRHLHTGVAGEGIKYTIQVTQGEAIFFPILKK